METKTLATAKGTVLLFLGAINNEDFKTARDFVTEDLTFIGVLGTRNGAEAYFNDMQKMKLKYDVKKAFEDGDDVSVFYDIDMSGKTIFS